MEGFFKSTRFCLGLLTNFLIPWNNPRFKQARVINFSLGETFGFISLTNVGIVRNLVILFSGGPGGSHSSVLGQGPGGGGVQRKYQCKMCPQVRKFLVFF